MRSVAGQRSESRSASAATSAGGGPPSGTRGRVFIADGLREAARRARVGQYRSLGLAVLLTVVAVGAVLAGSVADSEAFWAAAGGVFLVAFATLVAWTADQLGALAGTLGLLRAALKVEGADHGSEPDSSHNAVRPTEAELAFRIGDELRKSGHQEAAEHALRLAADDGHEEARFALGVAYEARADVREAVAWYLAAANQGHCRASYRLGRLHQANGPDDGIDIEAYKRAAKSGSSVAAYVLGERDAEAGAPMPGPDDLPEPAARPRRQPTTLRPDLNDSV